MHCQPQAEAQRPPLSALHPISKTEALMKVSDQWGPRNTETIVTGKADFGGRSTCIRNRRG